MPRTLRTFRVDFDQRDEEPCHELKGGQKKRNARDGARKTACAGAGSAGEASAP